MSDYNERACTNCGSLIHHEDNCPKPKSIEEIIKDEAKQRFSNPAMQQGYEAGRSQNLAREKEYREFLIAHEQWEADFISDNSMWWPHAEKDAARGKIYEKFLELQEKRNKLLGKFKQEETETIKCEHDYKYFQDRRICQSCGHTVYGDHR